MKLKFLYITFIALIAIPSFGQMKVKSRAYDNMLTNLLDHSVKEISVAEIDEKDNTIIYLDAREYKEYKVSHIKNAIWIGYNDFNVGRLKAVPKTGKIIVYCSVGYRSEKICEKLVKQKYGNIFNLYGSIFEWVNQGRPVYDMNNVKTDSVHAFDAEWGRWLKKGVRVYN